MINFYALTNLSIIRLDLDPRKIPGLIYGRLRPLDEHLTGLAVLVNSQAHKSKPIIPRKRA